MTVTHPITGKALKHYAQDSETRERYVVIALQNDTNPDTCSVVAYDALDAGLRAELLNAVNSDEFQRVPDIWKLLDRKYFLDYPKQTMLSILRALHQIRVVEQYKVKVELPNDTVMTPKEIVDAINQYQSEKEGRVARFNPEAEAKVESITSKVEDTRINDIEERMTKMESNIETLNSSIGDLINALKSQMSANKGE